jgi:hypothetical protein
VHDKFKGGVVPPAAALENELIGLGVASTLSDTARRILERSAEQAGFYEAARDRLVMPGFAPQDGASGDPVVDTNGGGGGRGGGVGGGPGGGEGSELGLDALLIALLKKIPTPEKGWPGPSRVRWFRTFAMNVSQIYDGDGEPVEMKIELEKEAAN